MYLCQSVSLENREFILVTPILISAAVVFLVFPLSMFAIPFSDSEKPTPVVFDHSPVHNHSPVAPAASSTAWLPSSPQWGSSTLPGALSTAPCLLHPSQAPASRARPLLLSLDEHHPPYSDFSISSRLLLPPSGCFLSPPLTSTP